jgi:hypothetical protein
MDEMGWAYKTQKEIKNAYKILIAKSGWNLPFEKNIHKWKDNVKIYLKKYLCDVTVWITFKWFNLESICELSWTLQWIFGFLKRWKISSPREWLFASHKRFFFFGAIAPIWTLAYLHETLRFTSVY